MRLAGGTLSAPSVIHPPFFYRLSPIAVARSWHPDRAHRPHILRGPGRLAVLGERFTQRTNVRVRFRTFYVRLVTRASATPPGMRAVVAIERRLLSGHARERLRSAHALSHAHPCRQKIFKTLSGTGLAIKNRKRKCGQIA